MTDHNIIGINFIPTDGYGWAEFLQQKLNEEHYNIRSILLDLTSKHSGHYETNILLISPDFFNLMHLDKLNQIDPHRALMVLLGTDPLQVKTFLLSNHCSHILKSITFFETEATESCVRELLIGIIKLYEHVHEASDEEYDTLPPPRQSYPPVKPLTQTTETLKVALSCDQEKREVYILCDRKGKDEIQIELTGYQEKIKAFHENKAIYRFSIDSEILSENLQFTAKDGQLTIGSGNIVFQGPPKGDHSSKKRDSRSKLDILQEVLGDEQDPICLMCKALNLSEYNKEALDTNLANKCKCLDPLRRFEDSFFEVDRNSKGHSNETWPSLLHFAAEFNLHKFCDELLRLPCSRDDCLKLNKDSETPLDIAKRKEYNVVAKILENYMDKDTRDCNKDSGVVEDSVSEPSLRSTDTYADMRQLSSEIDTSLSLEEDLPPPTAHATQKYINMGDSRHSSEDFLSPPVAHTMSEPKMSGDSDTSGLYMDMSAKSVPNFSAIESAYQKQEDDIHRSKSESAANDQPLEPDEDYEVPGSSEDIFVVPGDFDTRSVSSSGSSLFSARASLVEEIQLPTQAHHERQSGFFKKFFFGHKHHKKEKKQRGRKMSLPTETDIREFQLQRSIQTRRGSIPAVHLNQNRASSSSNSSGEYFVGSREDKTKVSDYMAEDKKQKKKHKHFLNKDARKSVRINRAMLDKSFNVVPLPPRSKHLLPPEL